VRDAAIARHTWSGAKAAAVDTCNYGPELDGQSLTSSELLLRYIPDVVDAGPRVGAGRGGPAVSWPRWVRTRR
jgi:hypothetical protein